MRNVKKVWERRSHAFPPHYNPAYSNIYVARTSEDLHPHMCNECEFFRTNYCIPKRWPMVPLQQSLTPWLKPLVTPLLPTSLGVFDAPHSDSTSPAVIPRPGNCAPPFPLVTPLDRAPF